MPINRKPVRDERGQALLEFALLAPLIILFLLAIVDFGMAVNRRLILDHAAREGARYASVGGNAFSSGAPVTCSEIQQLTANGTKGMFAAGTVDVNYEDANGIPGIQTGDNVEIELDYTYEFQTGLGSLVGVSLPGLPMLASADARLEYTPPDSTGC
ncbi:MAG: TadE family protein [Dehalococcoidia bacterium]